MDVRHDVWVETTKEGDDYECGSDGREEECLTLARLEIEGKCCKPSNHDDH